MLKLKRLLVAHFMVLAALYSPFAMAGILSWFSHDFEYEFKIVDEANQHVPSATIWVLFRRDDFTPMAMERLVKRYATDGNFDYVHNSFPLHGNQMVYYADTNGVFVKKYEEKESNKKEYLRISFAIIKRGYKPVVISEETPIGTTQKRTIKLERDPAYRGDPRMLKFDDLLAGAYNSDNLGTMSDKRSDLLIQTYQSIKKLADEFEQEGKLDEAARLYHHLAFMPSVDWYMGSDGRMAIGGYTNGFSDRSVQRMADLRKAWDLNKTNPQILLDKEIENYPSRKTRWPQKLSAKVIEEYIAKYPEIMWPETYYNFFNSYSKNATEACHALGRLYAFEPEYFNEKRWGVEERSIGAGLKFSKYKELKKTNPDVSYGDVHVDYECKYK